MPTINNGAVLEIAMHGRYDSRSDIVNVYQLQFLSGGPWEFSDLVGFVEDWVQAVLAIKKALQTTLMLWQTYSVKTLDNNIVSGKVPLTPTVTGSVTGDCSPLGAAALLYMNTGQSRRQLRKYVGPVAESFVNTSGQLTSAGTDVTTALLAYLLPNKSFAWGTVAYGHGNPGQNDFVRPLGGVASGTPAYQRRRRPGTGT